MSIIDESKNNNLRLYTRAEAAKALSISKSSLNNLIKDGLIGVIFIREQLYIPHASLLEFIESNTIRLQQVTESDDQEISLEKIRNIEPPGASSSKSLFILNQIMEQNNGKHLH